MAVSHANPKSNLAVANKRSTKVGYAKQHPQSILQHFSNSATDDNNNNNNNNKQNMAPTPYKVE